MEQKRDHALDNIRCFLIFLVVFAHFLEVCTPFWGSTRLYQIIYSFHMPAFLFLLGYNAKFSLKKILFRWILPYLIFQSLYILFARTVLHTAEPIRYTKPYWLLWFLLVGVFYQLLLPLYEKAGKRGQPYVLAGAFLLSLLVGFADVVGYEFSLSRFFVFQPWFLLGLYWKRGNFAPNRATRMISLAVVLLSVPFFIFAKIPNGLLYGSYSYANCGGALWMRVAVSVLALAWILLLFGGLKPYCNKKTPCITTCGQNTLSVFLMHGFLVKAISAFLPNLLRTPWQVLLLSCAILALLGNKFMNKIVSLIGGLWLERVNS